jgi:hypothetical protein
MRLALQSAIRMGTFFSSTHHATSVRERVDRILMLHDESLRLRGNLNTDLALLSTTPAKSTTPGDQL